MKPRSFFTVVLCLASVSSVLADVWQITTTDQAGRHTRFTAISTTFDSASQIKKASSFQLVLRFDPASAKLLRVKQSFKSILLERMGQVAGRTSVFSSSICETPKVTSSRTGLLKGKKVMYVTIRPGSARPS